MVELRGEGKGIGDSDVPVAGLPPSCTEAGGAPLGSQAGNDIDAAALHEGSVRGSKGPVVGEWLGEIPIARMCEANVGSGSQIPK